MRVLMIITTLLVISTGEYDRRVITTLKYSRHFVKPVVVNGQPASVGQVPYLISIKEPNGKLGAGRLSWHNLCGGSIISETKVLTAAHCFESHNFFYNKYPEILRLVAGPLKNEITHSGETETSEQGQWRGIYRVVLHNDFRFPINDIALVFVDLEWKFTSNVHYIMPASSHFQYQKPCYSAGFGRLGHTPKSSPAQVMLIAKIDVMSKWKCSLLWEMNMNNYICTDSAVSDVAMGDSGGPLACSGTLDPSEPGENVLVGIVSGKNYDKTTLYTRVSAYRDWIERDSCNRIKLSASLLYITWVRLIITWFSLIYLLFYW